jgi:hypothetical protein
MAKSVNRTAKYIAVAKKELGIGIVPSFESIEVMQNDPTLPVGTVVFIGGKYLRKDMADVLVVKKREGHENLAPRPPAPAPTISMHNLLVKRLSDHREYGKKINRQFALQTVYLGIGQAPRAAQKNFDTNTRAITQALEVGKLSIAIEEIRTVPENKLDQQFITAANLLKMRNKIHLYLGEPVVASYNQ